jgi:hypothetical protein
VALMSGISRCVSANCQGAIQNSATHKSFLLFDSVPSVVGTPLLLGSYRMSSWLKTICSPFADLHLALNCDFTEQSFFSELPASDV